MLDKMLSRISEWDGAAQCRIPSYFPEHGTIKTHEFISINVFNIFGLWLIVESLNCGELKLQNTGP